MKYLVTIETDLHSSSLESLKKTLSNFLDVPEENLLIISGVCNLKIHSTEVGSIKMLDISL